MAATSSLGQPILFGRGGRRLARRQVAEHVDGELRHGMKAGPLDHLPEPLVERTGIFRVTSSVLSLRRRAITLPEECHRSVSAAPPPKVWTVTLDLADRRGIAYGPE